MNITNIFYEFDSNKVTVENPYEVIKETEKCYFYKHEFGTGRILKDEVGKVLKRRAYGGNSSYLQLTMIDTDERKLREELSKWFTEEAYRVWRVYGK